MGRLLLGRACTTIGYLCVSTDAELSFYIERLAHVRILWTDKLKYKLQTARDQTLTFKFYIFLLSEGFSTKKMDRSRKGMILSTFCTTIFNPGTP